MKRSFKSTDFSVIVKNFELLKAGRNVVAQVLRGDSWLKAAAGVFAESRRPKACAQALGRQLSPKTSTAASSHEFSAENSWRGAAAEVLPDESVATTLLVMRTVGEDHYLGDVNRKEEDPLLTM